MKQIAVILLTTVFILAGTNACKDPEPPKGVVKVYYYKLVEGNPVKTYVENAMVILKPDSGQVVYFSDGIKIDSDTSYTDVSGTVSYEFKYDAILNVDVIKTPDRDISMTMTGEGVLILSEDEEYVEEIEIRI